MKPNDSLQERLLRLVDGRLGPAERAAVEAELRSHPEARAALRELAEQVVMIADLGRTVAARQRPTWGARPGSPRVRIPFWGLAAAAGLVLALGASTLWFRVGGRELGRVVKVTGSATYFGTRGSATDSVRPDISLRAGDMLETRSCDSWIEIELRDGTHLTIAGQSRLRVLASTNGVARLELPRGNLWSTPATNAAPAPLWVQTPTAGLKTLGTQFDLEATPDRAFVRVNRGSARILRTVDRAEVNVGAGQQTLLTLVPGDAHRAVSQPSPVMAWACDIGGTPEVILGRWLPPNAVAEARLAAVPLFWPIPDRPPLTLYAAALPVLRSSGQPVMLQAGSQIRFRGRTTRPQAVRFGFSTQRMRGVFAGKFELDVPASELGPAGQPWEITRRVSDFRPLQPQPAATPEGLELYDLYALTIQEDAGLEIHHVEVIPPEGGVESPK